MSGPTLPPFLHPFAKPTTPSFTVIERGDGALVWDPDGREYVDAMASLWYCAAGHGRAEIAEAVAAQLTTIAAYSCFEPFSNLPADELAERLVALTPIPDARVFFCGSGSEAVDTAMKLARAAHVLAGHPERTLIISRDRGYHGTNLGGTSAQGIAPNRAGWGPLVPDVVQVPSDDSEAARRADGRPGRRGRRRDHRAGAGRRRRAPTRRRLPRRAAAAVRPPWRAARSSTR